MKKRMLAALLTALLFGGLIIALMTVDRAPIGPKDTVVGLATLNQKVFSFMGEHDNWYVITGLLGGLSFLVLGCLAVMGLVQLIRRRDLMQVDRDILALIGLYAATAACYVLFEKVVINCRPVLLQGDLMPEASFPSTHTMLVCVIMGSAAMVLGRRVQPKGLKRLLQGFCILVILLTAVGRLLAGVHWFTDVLGAILLSLTLLLLYRAAAGE